MHTSRSWRAPSLPLLLLTPVLVLVAFKAFHQTLMLEEEEEDAGDFGSAARTGLSDVQKLTKNQADYMDRVDRTLIRYSSLAHRLRRRFWVATLASLLAAASVPVVIAADVSGWIPAALGAAAAVAQGTEQLMQDQKRSTEFHMMALALSRQRRALSYELGKLSDTGERSLRFDRFVNETELALEAGSARVLAIVSQEQAKLAASTTPASR